MASESGIMMKDRHRPTHHANDRDQGVANEVDEKSTDTSCQQGEDAHNSNKVNANTLSQPDGGGGNSHQKEDAAVKKHYTDSKDFKRFTKAVKSLLEYVNWNLDTSGSKRKDITGRAVVKKMLIDKLIEKEGKDKNKALLTVVGGKTTNDPDQYLLATQSLVLNFVNALLLLSADPTAKDDNGQNPIHHAVNRGFREVLSRLLKNDDTVSYALENDKAKEKQSLLHTALHIEREKDVKDKDKLAEIIIRRLPNDEVQKAFLPASNKTAAYSLCDVLKMEMTNTALAVLDSMIDSEGQKTKEGQGQKAGRILIVGECGWAVGDPDFLSSSYTTTELIALTENKDVVCHRLVKQYIKQKWKAYARTLFIMKLGAFLLSVVFMTFAAITGVTTSDPKHYDSALDYARGCCEVATLISAFIKGCGEIFQIYSYKLYYFKDFTNYFDWASICCLVAVVPLRWTDTPEQWQVFAVGYLIWIFDIFKYAAITRNNYDYSQTLKRMVYRVFPQFISVFLVILVAFSGSFLLALKGENSLGFHDETSNYWKILFTGVRILIEGDAVVDYAGPDGYKSVSAILMTGFLFVSCVVLLNILIAQMTDTYKDVQENKEGGFLLARLWIIIKVNWLLQCCCNCEMEEETDVCDTEEWSSDEDEDTQLDIKAVNTNLKEIKETLKDITKRLEHNTTEQGRSVGFRPGHST